jgi:hypothetical protein
MFMKQIHLGELKRLLCREVVVVQRVSLFSVSALSFLSYGSLCGLYSGLDSSCSSHNLWMR